MIISEREREREREVRDERVQKKIVFSSV